jgi:glycerate dehydrogenase
MFLMNVKSQDAEVVKKMNIVIFDGYTINPGDLSWDKLDALCDKLTVFDSTSEDKALSRLTGNEILMTSKCPITRELMENSPQLKYIGCTATGYNNIDVEAAADLGIAVTNIPAYSTDAVAQHTIALMLELSNHVGLHNASVQDGQWSDNEYFCYWKKSVTLLTGKSLGIIGYGAIGKRVAQIARALGMEINIFSQDPAGAMKSDFVSLHCPLTRENRHMVNTEFLVNMKPGAILINTARGGLVDERALADAIKAGFIAGAALDVLEQEPPAKDCPLIGLDNCIITPHIAWSPKEMRQAVIDILAENLESWLTGGMKNRVD